MPRNDLSIVQLVLIIIIVNAIGFALKYFELDTYLIFVGFRFHLSAVLPFLLVIRSNHFSKIKQVFLEVSFKQIIKVTLLLFLIFLVFLAVLYFSKKIKIGDPEYFYEFGLSSIFDYPIYLVWNSIQLIFTYLFFVIIKDRLKNSFLVIFLFSVLLFAYEFIPIDNFKLDYWSIASFILLCCIASLLISQFRDLYLFIIVIFSTVWLSILAFGTTSTAIVNLFFASRYSSWEGFFIVDKDISKIIIPGNYFIILLFLLVIFLIRKKKVQHNN